MGLNIQIINKLEKKIRSRVFHTTRPLFGEAQKPVSKGKVGEMNTKENIKKRKMLNNRII